MQPVLEKVKEFIEERGLLKGGEGLLLSMSAGKDSMALLHIMLELREEYSLGMGVFHLNHMVRGKESDLDEDMLRDITGKYGLPLYAHTHDFMNIRTPGTSFEEDARNIRYALLRKTAEEGGYGLIATAHNRDDNVETLLMRIFRGTGIAGLGGISPMRDGIIRPLLCLTVEEIYGFLREQGIPWREDSTNRDNSIPRNYIRNIIMPAVRERFPGAESSIGMLSEHAREAEAVIQAFAGSGQGGIVRECEHGVLIFTDGSAQDPALLRHLVMEEVRGRFNAFVSRGMLSEIERNMGTGRTHCLLYSNSIVTIEKTLAENRPAVRITGTREKRDAGEWEYSVTPDPLSATEIYLKEIGLSLTVEYADRAFFMKNFRDTDYIFVTMHDQSYPLYIRNRRDGDRIHLERGSKKIKDLLIEKKLDNESKNCVPLLIIDSQIAACITGFQFNIPSRIARKFLVTGSTKKILAIYKKQQ